jgi:hypothetical protein
MPLQNNLGGVTDRQTCTESLSCRMVITYVQVGTNEHIK